MTRISRLLASSLLLAQQLDYSSTTQVHALSLSSLSTLPLFQQRSSQLRRRSPATSSSSPSTEHKGQAGDFVCRTVGQCEPCSTESARKEPSCQLYGSRRPLLCVTLSSQSQQHSSSPTTQGAGGAGSGGQDHNAHRPVAGGGGGGAGTGSGGRDDDDEERLISGPPGSSDPKQGGGGGSRPPSYKPKQKVSPSSPGLDPEPENLDDEDVVDALREKIPGAMRRWQGEWGVELERRDEIHTWEACEKVVKKEREDFMEFVLCNVGFALVALSILFSRHRTLAGIQYTRLAARIGLNTV
ncbi:hypothetical protein T439DRAFT_382486 [Meredithblackwellia eburnea MCA 4105]